MTNAALDEFIERATAIVRLLNAGFYESHDEAITEIERALRELRMQELRDFVEKLK